MARLLTTWKMHPFICSPKQGAAKTVKYNRSRNGLYVLASKVEKIFNQNFKILWNRPADLSLVKKGTVHV